MMHSIINPRS